MNSAGDTCQQLVGLRHHESEAVQVIEHLQEFASLEVLDRICQLTAFAEGIDEIGSGLRCTFGGREKYWVLHGGRPFEAGIGSSWCNHTNPVARCVSIPLSRVAEWGSIARRVTARATCRNVDRQPVRCTE